MRIAEIVQRDNFPPLDQLKPNDEHRKLLERIDRKVLRSFPDIVLVSEVPAFYLPTWNQYPRPQWRQLHAYALVRRAFDSLLFLARDIGIGAPGAMRTGIVFQVQKQTGKTLRVRDPYEDFLAALVAVTLLELSYALTAAVSS